MTFCGVSSELYGADNIARVVNEVTADEGSDEAKTAEIAAVHTAEKREIIDIIKVLIGDIDFFDGEQYFL